MLYFLNKGEISVSIKNTDTKEKDLVNVLKDGSLFGEVAMLTKQKRTATCVSEDYSNCARLNKEDIAELEANFPHIVRKFKVQLKDYKDDNMNFRRQMIRNIYYLSDLNDVIIDEIICNLEVKRYNQGSIIIKNGEVSDKLMFLRHGEIDIKVNR